MQQGSTQVLLSPGEVSRPHCSLLCDQEVKDSVSSLEPGRRETGDWRV